MVTKLSQSQLKRLMQLEMKKLMDEDALFIQKRIPGDYDYDVINFQRSAPTSMIDNDSHNHDDEACCDVCAAEKHSDNCECDICSMQNVGIFESCGCSGGSYENPYSMEREEDYDYKGKSLSIADMHVVENELEGMDPHEAYGQGYLKGNTFDKKSSSYMARPQLYKISKYASKLLDMVDEHEELEDWQESKIAQIAQMIGSVYHSLDYDEVYEEDEDLILSNLI